ncbi:MAG: phosphoribosyltransferase [Candidatus Andersenbacteria bacterium]|nr:phosphoribosyltransferase [Candidatus Andersenbacteria bacterium]
MSYLAEYKKSDFKKVLWEEYGKTLEIIFGKVNRYIKKNDIKIDAVVPILRGGSFPGTYLTFKLDLLRILPVQYKYFLSNDKIELKKIFSFSKRSLDGKKSPVFLLVENNHCFGLTASTAAKDLKKMFPGCRIIYAVDHIDYSYQKIDNVEKTFYGKLTNETKALNDKECKIKKIENICYLFPWENLDEEMTTVKGKQFIYGDLDEVYKNSKLKVDLEN